jgi:hypothetical protein
MEFTSHSIRAPNRPPITAYKVTADEASPSSLFCIRVHLRSSVANVLDAKSEQRQPSGAGFPVT